MLSSLGIASSSCNHLIGVYEDALRCTAQLRDVCAKSQLPNVCMYTRYTVMIKRLHKESVPIMMMVLYQG